MAGRIQRVNQVFSGDLPTLVLYDFARVRSQIAKLPSCRAFYDFVDPASITKDSSNLVSQVSDFSPNGQHLIASGTDRPTVVAGAMPGGFQGLYFSGTNRMSCATLFTGAERLTIACGIFATGADGTSRYILTDSDNAQPAWYLTSTQLRHFAGDQVLTVTSVVDRLASPRFTMDNISNVLRIYSGSTTTTPATGTKTRPKPVGSGTVGNGIDGGGNANAFIGYMGYLIILEEDVGTNAAALALINEYHNRRFRVA